MSTLIFDVPAELERHDHLAEPQARFVPEFTVGTHELPSDPSRQPKVKATLLPIVSPNLYGLGVQGAW